MTALSCWLVPSILVSPGCHRVFTCADDDDCELDGVAGACEPNGYCSFPDADCESGRRYGQHASRVLAGACVDEAVADAGTEATGEGTGSDTTEANGTTGDDDAPTDDTQHDPCDGLRESGPVVATADGQVIEGLRITADFGHGIDVVGRRGVTIRNCEIHHRNGAGISFRAAHDLTIENVVVVHDAPPEEGPHADGAQNSIEGRDSTGLVMSHVRASHGSSGITLQTTPAARLSFIEVHDVRGPGLAACVAFVGSDGSVLEDFSCENPLDTGRPHHLVEILHSSNVTVRRGLLDGHNGEHGFGVHFEHTSGQHSGGLVEDVDGARMTAGAFSCHPDGFHITFRRTRARENICEILSVPVPGCKKPGPNGGCIPHSNGVSWTASDSSNNIVIEESSFYDLCFDTTWPASVFTIGEGDLVEEDFELRSPIRLELCWE